MRQDGPRGWSRPESPFHAGELSIQDRLGIRARLDTQARIAIHEQMPDQHRAFFTQLPWVLTGLADHAGQPWASLLVGRPGFLSSPDPRTLRIDAHPLPGDPAADALRVGAAIGLLGIELPTRRRNRMNGRLDARDARGFTVTVDQSFGNCPKYIQTRAPVFIADPADPPAPSAVTRSGRLDPATQSLIRAADTFFIASANLSAAAGPAGGVDISHRGGKPGFVRIDDAATLTVPDFAGNLLFNTLGNLLVSPHGGLLFIDFDSGDLVQLAVEAEIVWEGPDVQAFAGAERLLRLHVREVVRRAAALPLRWSAPDFSPVLARTGSWGSARDGA